MVIAVEKTEAIVTCKEYFLKSRYEKEWGICNVRRISILSVTPDAP